MTQAVFIALVWSHCGGNFVTPKTQDDIVECMTRAVNCSITGDGSQIENKQVRECLKKIPGSSKK
jgi:hypothetical protein